MDSFNDWAVVGAVLVGILAALNILEKVCKAYSRWRSFLLTKTSGELVNTFEGFDVRYPRHRALYQLFHVLTSIPVIIVALLILASVWLESL